MAKETVRFPDDLVARIKEAVGESEMFESRSEFHRVSSELLLDLLDSEHEPTNFSYRELRAEIEDELGVSLAGAPPFEGIDPGEGAPDFMEAYVAVRRRALHGDVEGAREVVRERYEPTAPEALLLDEVIGHHRPPGASADRVGSGRTEPPRPSGERGTADARGDRDPDGAREAERAVEDGQRAVVDGSRGSEEAAPEVESDAVGGRAGTDGDERRTERPHQ